MRQRTSAPTVASCCSDGANNPTAGLRRTDPAGPAGPAGRTGPADYLGPAAPARTGLAIRPGLAGPGRSCPDPAGPVRTGPAGPVRSCPGPAGLDRTGPAGRPGRTDLAGPCRTSSPQRP